MVKLHFRSDNQLQLLHSGQDFFTELLRTLAQAQQEIYLETYIFSDDATANRIRDALCDAAQRGVRVHVMIDWLGSGRGRSQQLAQYLGSRGVLCRLFNPWFKRGVARTHRKLVAIDQMQAFVGGINIIDDLLADDGSGKTLPAARWDFAVLVQGTLVADIRQELAAQWLKLGHLALLQRVNLMRLLDLPAFYPTMTNGQSAAFVIRDNLRHRSTIQKAYLHALGSAKKQVILANPYFAPGRKFRRALVSAASRGVRTRLLIGVGEFRLQDAVTRSLYPTLLQHGVEIIEYHRTQLHAKVAIVDEQWATVGSSNVDGFSLFVNHEANLVIHDARLNAQLRQYLEQGIQEGVAIHLQDYAKRPWWKRVLYGVAYFCYRMMMKLVTWGGYT